MSGILGMIAEKFKGATGRWRETIETWAKGKIRGKIDTIVDKIPEIIKRHYEDPDMPRCASRNKDKAIDVMWPEFKEELMWEIDCMLDGVPNATANDDEPAACCFLRFFRYHLYPHDKSIWGKLRDPIWCGFFLLSCVPVAGLCPLIFLFFFFIIDKRDQYQCIAFILQFKGFQFITMGVIGSIQGFFRFMSCVSANGDKNDHECENSGPGVMPGYEVVVSGFFLQIILVWTVYFIFRCCAVEKGRSKLKGHFEHEQLGTKTKGGFITYFLFYDLFCFVIIMGFLCYVISTRPDGIDSYNEWVVQQSLFACQVVYGYLSLPFFFFTIPYFQNILLHIVPTAYDKKGRTRGYKWPDSVEEQRRKEAEEKAAKSGGFVSMEEAGNMLGSITSMFSSETSDGDGKENQEKANKEELPGAIAILP